MPIDCDSDPIGSLSRMFINMTMGPRILAGQCPVHRAVFLKPHGVAWGTFFIAPDLPADLRVGVFAGGEYPCWVRFSSDTLPLVPDLCTTMGLAIKLFDIPGKKLLPGEEAGLTQDFLLQFIERFFVPNATEMCRFTRAGVVEHNYDSYIDAHPVTKTVLAEMGKRVPSVFATPYWSVLPYALGPAQHVKYRVDAETTAYTGALSSATQPNFLHDDLKARLLAGEVRMNFAVQPRTDPEGMPLDDATVIWSEAASPRCASPRSFWLVRILTRRANPNTAKIWRSTRGTRCPNTRLWGAWAKRGKPSTRRAPTCAATSTACPPRSRIGHASRTRRPMSFHCRNVLTPINGRAATRRGEKGRTIASHTPVAIESGH
jgi:hypothetical protein